mgnify:CR=1 FL=1
MNKTSLSILCCALLLWAWPTNKASATPIGVRVTVENTSPLNTVTARAFTSLFHDNSGSFAFHDYFDEGDNLNFPPYPDASAGECTNTYTHTVACAVLFGNAMGFSSAVSLSNDPDSVPNEQNVAGAGFITAGTSQSLDILVDPGRNFFSFFSSINPSNDSFIGTDTALDISALFGLDIGDALPAISIRFSDIYNLGIEADSPFGAVVFHTEGGVDGIAEDQPISRGTTDFTVFDSLGFNFSALTGDPEVLRITLTRISTNPVPEPAGLSILGLGLLGFAALSQRRRRQL